MSRARLVRIGVLDGSTASTPSRELWLAACSGAGTAGTSQHLADTEQQLPVTSPVNGPREMYPDRTAEEAEAHTD